MLCRAPRLLALGPCLALLAGCPSGTPQPGTPAPDASEPAAPTPRATVEAVEVPFDRAALRTPWRLAEVGDWAVYTMHLPRGARSFRFEVTEVAERTVTFARKDPESGAVLDTETIDLAEEERRYKDPSDPETYDGLARDAAGDEIAPYRAKVEVGGKELEAVVVKRAREGLGSTELWLAEDRVRPFMQSSVKSLQNGVLQSELIDFGGAKD